MNEGRNWTRIRNDENGMKSNLLLIKLKQRTPQEELKNQKRLIVFPVGVLLDLISSITIQRNWN